MSDSGHRPHTGSVDRIPLGSKITPLTPAKRINTGDDLQYFLCSTAYKDVTVFIRQLNHAVFPRITTDDQGQPIIRSWPTSSLSIVYSPQVMRMKVLIQTLQSMLKEAPPDPGPRRYGNAAFRKWHALLHERVPGLLQQALPENIWNHVEEGDRVVLRDELAAYLLGAFGSPERLDYGTGHELSFIAFLACLWKLNGFAPSEDGSEERGMVVGVVDPYIDLVRKLILTYTLEPAGSHGVWGLDDHFFIPYILGSAQFSPPVRRDGAIPQKGALESAPPPGIVTSETTVKQQANQNLYLAAVKFIYSVKKGPFWEHSPTLYDISGLQDGWAKINKGLLKMYDAEVLSKFPIVQHFPFGSLFPWQMDPTAPNPQATPHTSSYSANDKTSETSAPGLIGQMAPPRNSAGSGAGTTAPWGRSGVASTGVAPGPGGGASGLPQSSRSRMSRQGSSTDESTLSRIGRNLSFARSGSGR